MNPPIIAVSGINATENPGPGVAVARSLKEAFPGVKVIGLSYDPNDPGHYLKKWIDQSFILPFPTKGWSSMFARLKEVQEKTGFDLLIPNLDVELPLLIKYHQECIDSKIKTYLPSETQFDLRSKSVLGNIAEEIGCLYPKTWAVFSDSEIIKILNSQEFPKMIKGNYYKAYKVFNVSSALEKAAEISAEWGYPILIQQPVSGAEINLVGLGNGEGDLCGAVCIKKQTVTSLGKVWTAITIKDQMLFDLGKEFCRQTKWKGPFEIEAIRSQNKIYLIEINPRFPAWIYFATAVGVNLPARLFELAHKGTCTNSIEYPSGLHLIRHTEESLGDIGIYQDLITEGQQGGESK